MHTWCLAATAAAAAAGFIPGRRANRSTVLLMPSDSGDISSLHTGRHNAALYHQTLTAQLRGLALVYSAADRSAIEISPAQKRRNIQGGGGSTRASGVKFTNALWPNGVPDTMPRRAVHKVGTVSTTHSSPFLLLY